MSNGWPKFTLGDILVQDRDYVTTLEMRVYPKLSVKLYGKGVILDSPTDASQLKMQRHQLAKAGQVILSEIWGKKGAIGFVPAEGEGALCTSHFFLFDVIRSQIEPGWLDAIFRANYLAQQLGATAFGTTGYAAVRPKDLLAATIPLPPLTEQQRIVAKVEELAAKIDEARGLQQRGEREIDALWESSLHTIFDRLYQSTNTKTFGEVCDVVRGGSPRPAGSPTYYDGPIPFLKVGDITKDTSKYVSTYTSTIKEAGLSRSRQVEPDTLMLTNSGATLGVPKICTIQTCFNDGIQAYLNLPDDLSKEYLYYFLLSRTQWFREQAARGQGQPNLNTSMVKSLSFPQPDFDEQRRIVAYLDELQAKVNCVKALQAQTHTELDALLPSILDKAFKGEL